MRPAGRDWLPTWITPLRKVPVVMTTARQRMRSPLTSTTPATAGPPPPSAPLLLLLLLLLWPGPGRSSTSRSTTAPSSTCSAGEVAGRAGVSAEAAAESPILQPHLPERGRGRGSQAA